jgi:hypothetical protein
MMIFKSALSLAMTMMLANYAHAETVWYRDPELGISFAYNNSRWKEVNPAETTTKHVVNWYDKTGGLAATCYLQTMATDFGRAIEGKVHSNKEVIEQSIMNNLKKRDPDAKLIKGEATWSDNIEVIYLERTMTMKSLNRTSVVVSEGIVTGWRGNEVYLECAYDNILSENAVALAFVRQEIEKVLRTLHFERQ